MKTPRIRFHAVYLFALAIALGLLVSCNPGKTADTPGTDQTKPVSKTPLSKAAKIYAASCASCHGPEMQGGNAQSLVDGVWQFGDGTTSTEINPAHIYPDSGRYSVTLYVWSEHNCPDTLVFDRLIELAAGEGSTLFPNAFVWNGTGPTGGHWQEGQIDNTIFHPHMINPVGLKLSIYTRWGEKIWETDHFDAGWDGTSNGTDVAEGTYFWVLEVYYSTDASLTIKGTVTVLR